MIFPEDEDSKVLRNAGIQSPQYNPETTNSSLTSRTTRLRHEHIKAKLTNRTCDTAYGYKISFPCISLRLDRQTQAQVQSPSNPLILCASKEDLHFFSSYFINY
jgi:hypothetical protein